MYKGILTCLIVAAYALTCCAVETWVDRKCPNHADVVFLLVVGLGAAIIAVVAVMHFGRLI